MRRVAVAGLQQRLKPREREVLGHVLIGAVGRAGVRLRRARRRPRRRVGSPAILSPRVVHRPTGVGIAEILGVALPAHARLVELVEQRRHRAGIHAPVLTDGGVGTRRGRELPVVGVAVQIARIVDRPRDRVVVRTVRLRVGEGRLPTGQRQVVVQRVVSRAVVVLEQDTLRRKRLPQVSVVVETRERRVIGLVLQNDQPHVLDLPRPDPDAVEILLPPRAIAPA